MNLQNKVVVVTGGGSGIGQHIVLTLLNRGALVAVVDISAKALEETRQQAGEAVSNRLTLHQTDIADRQAVSLLAGDVVRQHGKVDVIINNAGIIHPFEPLHVLEENIIDKVINVNLHGVLNMTRAFLPFLLQRPEARIVNISSMGGLFAFPKQTVYGATKAAVKLISEGLYSELRGTPVGVTVIFPGAVDTNIAVNCDAQPKHWDRSSRFNVATHPAKAASQIVAAIEKNRFRVHIGLDSKILSVLYRLFPGFTVLILGKLMKLALPD